MQARINPHKFSGVVRVPASKSHTIRQLLIASLADGLSEINFPLDSLDTRSCISACKAFGAQILEQYAIDETCPNPANENGEKLVKWVVKGNSKFLTPHSSLLIDIDVGNSGTTLYLALAIAGLQSRQINFTGDEQIKRRSAAPLLEALSGLGITVESNNGCAPISIKGPWKGGKVSLPCPTSQYLSALLLAAPLAPEGTVTEIDVPLLNEKPYIDMTLSYLKSQGILFEYAEDYSHFLIRGGCSYKPFSSNVPGDFSSAAFPAAAAAISGGEVTLLGLDPEDSQGDKFFFEMLAQMNAEIKWEKKGSSYQVTVIRKGKLRGGTFDLNATPDLFPAAAAVAAFAEGDTALVNVAHARLKETDRIAVMLKELAKLGVQCTELPDGLIIHGRGNLLPATCYLQPVLDGHGDHRIVMALAAVALGCPCPVEISGAECADVTYPGFLRIIDAEIF